MAVALGEPAAAALCTVTPSPVGFPMYNPTSISPDNGAGTITLGCLVPGQVLVTLSPGGAGTFAPRAMAGPSSLHYNLYVDSARAQVWGDGTQGTSTVSTFVPFVLVLIVYGRVFPQQSVAAGAYADTITATINF